MEDNNESVSNFLGRSNQFHYSPINFKTDLAHIFCRLDDVRTAVRERGETLGRAVRALTIRLCDPTMTDLAQDSDVYLSNAQRKQREKQQEISAENAGKM